MTIAAQTRGRTARLAEALLPGSACVCAIGASVIRWREHLLLLLRCPIVNPETESK
jgi:hypothetical protein